MQRIFSTVFAFLLTFSVFPAIAGAAVTSFIAESQIENITKGTQKYVGTYILPTDINDEIAIKFYLRNPTWNTTQEEVKNLFIKITPSTGVSYISKSTKAIWDTNSYAAGGNRLFLTLYATTNSTVQVGDTRATRFGRDVTRSGGSIVALGDPDIGMPTHTPTGTGYIFTTGADGVWNTGEFLYVDSDLNDSVSVGDIRANNYTSTLTNGSVVATGDADIGTALTQTTNLRSLGNTDDMFDIDGGQNGLAFDSMRQWTELNNIRFKIGNTATQNSTISYTIYSTDQYGASLTPLSGTINLIVNSSPKVSALSASKSSVLNNCTDSFTLSATISDPNGLSNISTVTADLTALGSGSAIAMTQVGSTNIWNSAITTACPTGTTSAGTKNITVKATDSDGNSGSITVSSIITVNTPTNPKVSILTIDPTATFYLTGGEILNFSFTGSTSGNYFIRGDSTTYTDGTDLASGYYTGGTTNISINSNSFTSTGDHTVDIYLQTGAEAGRETIRIFRDTTTPTVTIGTQSRTAVGTDSDTVDLNANFSELGIYTICTNCTSPSGGTFIISGTLTNTNKVISFNATNLTEGTNNLKLYLTDTAGNAGFKSFSVTKDTTPPPAVGSVSFSDTDTTGDMIDGRDFTVSWGAISDPNFASYRVYILPNGTTLDTATHTYLANIQNIGTLNWTGGTGTTTDSAGNSLGSLGGSNAFVAHVATLDTAGRFSTIIPSASAAITADDTTTPTLVSASILDRNTIRTKWSEPLSTTGTIGDFTLAGITISDLSLETDARNLILTTAEMSTATSGTISISANTIKDLNGNFNAATQTASVADTLSPVFTSISPTGQIKGHPQIGYTLSENTQTGSLRLVLTASSGTDASAPYTIYIASGSYSTTNSNSGSHTVDLDGATIGLTAGVTYSMTLFATDIANIDGNLASGSFIYDSTNPTLTLTGFTANGATNTGAFTSAASETLASGTITFTRTGGIVGGSDITLILSNTGLTTTQINTAATLFSGQNYDITYFIEDLSGRTGSSTISNVKYDTDAPSAPSFFNPPAFINSGAYLFTWGTGYDGLTGAGLTGYTIDLSVASDFSPISITSTVSTTGATLSGMTDGTWYTRILATDSANNSSTYLTGSFIVDTITPIISGATAAFSVSGITATVVASGSTLFLLTQITDNSTNSTGNLTISNITADFSALGGGAAVSPTSFTSTGWATWTGFTVSATGDSTKNITITAIDNATNSTGSTISIILDNIAPPVASLTAPTASIFHRTDTDLTIAYSISDTNFGTDNVTVEYSTGGSFAEIATRTTTGSDTFTWTGSNIPDIDASTTIRFRVSDLAGNESISNTRTITLDATDPILTPSTASGTSFAGAQAVNLVFTGAEALDYFIELYTGSLSSVPENEWQFLGSGTTISADTKVVNWTTPTIDVTGAKLRYRATDLSGRTGSTAITINIAGSPPTVTNAAYTNDTTLTITLSNPASTNLADYDFATTLSGISLDTGVYKSIRLPISGDKINIAINSVGSITATGTLLVNTGAFTNSIGTSNTSFASVAITDGQNPSFSVLRALDHAFVDKVELSFDEKMSGATVTNIGNWIFTASGVTISPTSISFDGNTGATASFPPSAIAANDTIKITHSGSVTDTAGTPISNSSGTITATAQLILNEIMTDSLANTGTGGQWFEIYNHTTSNIDLNGWTLTNTGNTTLTLANFTIPANSYTAFAANTGNTTFANYNYGTNFKISTGSEILTLKNASGITMDTISFSSISGRSHARLNSGAWLTSTGHFNTLDRGSPSLANTGTAISIEKISGDTQNGEMSANLANDFQIQIIDGFGNTMSGENITFSIYSAPSGISQTDNANIYDYSTTNTGITITNSTNSGGLASTKLKLGNRAGDYIVRATGAQLFTTRDFTAFEIPKLEWTTSNNIIDFGTTFAENHTTQAINLNIITNAANYTIKLNSDTILGGEYGDLPSWSATDRGFGWGTGTAIGTATGITANTQISTGNTTNISGETKTFYFHMNQSALQPVALYSGSGWLTVEANY